MKRQTLIGITAWLTAPLALLSILGWVNCFFNPMMSTFMDTFRVHNSTQRPVAITALGRVGGDAPSLRVLPQFRYAHPALPQIRDTRRLVNTGQTIKFIYDADNYQLTELLIECAGEKPRVFAAAPYTISDLHSLPIAPRETLEALAHHHCAGWHLIWMIGGVIPTTLAATWFALRNKTNRHHQARAA